MAVVTLDKLAPGESGRVVRVHGRGAIRRRLVDMGLTSGAVIEVVKLSPLGDPVEYRLRSYHLSLRTSEARTIEVELLDGLQFQPRRRHRVRGAHPLTRFSPGQRVEIVSARGGRGVSRQIRELGLLPGSAVTIVQNQYPGPLIVSRLDQDRLVIGKGLARHILAKSTP